MPFKSIYFVSYLVCIYTGYSNDESPEAKFELTCLGKVGSAASIGKEYIRWGGMLLVG